MRCGVTGAKRATVQVAMSNTEAAAQSGGPGWAPLVEAQGKLQPQRACAPGASAPGASAPGASAPAADMQVGGVLALAFGHTTCDFFATYLTPLLPLLADKFQLSTLMCSALVAAVGISGSTLQPVFGAFGAKRAKGVIIVGLLLMAVFFSCIGLAPNVPTLFVLLFVGALGCSFFHPHAAAIATRMSAGRRGLAMSLFTVAGTAGLFLSPKIVPRIATTWGLEGLVMTMPLGFVCCAILALTPMKALEPHRAASPAAEWRPGARTGCARTEWRGLLSGDLRHLSFLVVSAVLYSLTICGLAAFLPLMLCREKDFTVTAAGDMLAWLILAGAAGVVLGGYLSDRFGQWRVIMAAYLVSVPLFTGFLRAEGPTALMLLMGGGMALWAAQPCTITLAQELAPKASGIASGLVMGFAWGMAGLFLPIFGMIADRAGTSHAMQWVVLLPIGAAASLWAMKRFRRKGFV